MRESVAVFNRRGRCLPGPKSDEYVRRHYLSGIGHKRLSLIVFQANQKLKLRDQHQKGERDDALTFVRCKGKPIRRLQPAILEGHADKASQDTSGCREQRDREDGKKSS